MMMGTQPRAWSCPMAMAEAGAGSSTCLLCSLTTRARVALPVFVARREGTSLSPAAASSVTADPGNKEKLGQKEIFTEVNIADGGGDAAACLRFKIIPSGGRSLLRSLSLKRCHIKGMRGWSTAGPLCRAGPPWGPPEPKGDSTKAGVHGVVLGAPGETLLPQWCPWEEDSLALPPSDFPARHKSGRVAASDGAIHLAGLQVITFH